MEKRGTTRVTTETTIELAGKDIATMLKGYIQAWGFSIENIQRMYVRVPGGGDWSNTDLDIDRNCPLVIVFKKEVVQ